MKTLFLLALVLPFLLLGCAQYQGVREIYIEIPDANDPLAKQVIQKEFADIQKEFGNALWTGQALDKIEPNQLDTYVAQFGFGDRAREDSSVRFSCQIQKRNVDDRRPLPRVLRIHWLRSAESHGPIPYSTIANRVITALADSGVELRYIGATDIDFYGKKIKEE